MITAESDSTRRSAAIKELGQKVCDAIAGLVSPGSRVALLDFPDYGNVGDSAIWLAQLAALDGMGATVAYTASASAFSAAELRRVVTATDGIVLLSGGGNFGDLWPVHGDLRRKVLTELRDFRVVQLPQSIHFEDARNREDMRVLLEAHPSFSLMVRDEPSRIIAETALGHPAILCPDVVFALGPLQRPRSPELPVVWLSRQDKERPAERSRHPGDPEPVDWVDEPLDDLPLLERAAERWMRRGGWLPQGMNARVLRARAELRFRHGTRLLSRGSVVVTNRLHAMVLALLLGIPHFVSDTRQGKIGAFHRTWLSDVTPGVLCDSESQALDRAQAAVAAMGGKAHAAH